MKNLNIEIAETLPMRERIPVRQRWSAWDLFGFNHLKRFISKYVNKPYNLCYSDFLHKVKCEKHLNEEYRNEVIQSFKDLFITHTYRANYFYVDDEGLVQKHQPFGFHKDHTITIYTLKDDAFIRKRYKYYSSPEFFQECINGITYSDFRDKCPAILGYRSIYFDFNTHTIAKPEVTPRQHYERIDKERKKTRDRLKQKEEALEKDLHFMFHQDKTARKRELLRLKKLQEEENLRNIITRDRLGFDETSFKTYR